MVKSSFKITHSYNNIVINGIINGKPYKKVFTSTFKRHKDYYLYSLKHNLVKCKRYSEHHPLNGYYYEHFRKTKNGYKRTLKHFNKYSGYKHKTELINENEYLYKIFYKRNHKLQFIKQIEYVFKNGKLIKIRKYNNGNLIKESII